MSGDPFLNEQKINNYFAGIPPKKHSINMDYLNKAWQQKHLLKKRLRMQDLGEYMHVVYNSIEKKESVSFKTFELEIYKVGMTIQARDLESLG